LQPKLQNCILSLSVLIQKKVQRGRQQKPKTLDLHQPPFYVYHVYVGIENVLAYSTLPLKMRFCQAVATKLATAAVVLPPTRCR
jgi:hypothetical protein